MEKDRYFKIPIKGKYALFTFKPYQRMIKILESFNIPYEMFSSREEVFRGKKFKTVKCEQQKLTKYKILNGSEEIIPDFFFTADIIDKILDYYKVEYEKGGSLGEERSMS